MNFLRRYNFEARIVSRRIWSLMEAAGYIAAHRAKKENLSNREEAFNGYRSIRNNLLTAMNKSIEMGNLVVNEVYLENNIHAAGSGPSTLDVYKSTVKPFILINWALAQDIEVPIESLTYVNTKKSDKSANFEYLGVKISTIHHERSRAIAELLWRIEPDIPIAQMARRSEIIEIGCQRHEYDMRTISRWLASLKDDRHPGQPRKKKGLTGNVKNDDRKHVRSL